MAAPRTIHVYNRQRSVRFDLRWLRKFAALALAECEAEGIAPGAALELLEEIEVSIVSDKVIAEVHQRFMSIAGPTDVITFGHGEIVISAETAARQAGEFGERLEVELGLYVIHGILHLNGYDDLEEGVAAGMRKRQGEILGRVLRVVNAPA